MFDTLAYLPSPGYAPGISTTYGTPPTFRYASIACPHKVYRTMQTKI